MAKLIVNPTSSSRREILLPRSLMSIGRDPSNDLVLPDAMVSRRHAVIEFRGNQYFLRDCNSSNGSLVNGDRVSERNLRDGDLVAIGTARLLFREEVEIEDAGAKVVQHPSAPRQHCPNCNADFRKGDLFCRQCGAQLVQGADKVVCASCGTAVPMPARFCNACGTALPKEDGQAGLESTKPRHSPEEVPGSPEASPEASSGAAAAEPGDGAEAVPPAPAAPPSAAPAAAPAVDPLDSPRPSRSAAAAEPALPSPRPVIAEAPRPLAVPMERPRPAVIHPRAERGPHEIEKREARAAPAKPAGFAPRLVAGLIDGAIVTVGGLLLMTPGALYWLPRKPEEVTFLPILLSVLLLVVTLLLAGGYYVYFWGVRGATPGKQLLDLVVEGEDGAFPIGFPKAIARFLGYALSTVTLGIGFMMIAANGIGLHDRVAGTRVVRRERA